MLGASEALLHDLRAEWLVQEVGVLVWAGMSELSPQNHEKTVREASPQAQVANAVEGLILFSEDVRIERDEEPGSDNTSRP